MATRTPIHHPRFAQQMGQFYPYTVSVLTLKGESVKPDLACSYTPAKSGEPMMFEGEAPSSDKILIPSWEPTIKAKMQAILTIGGEVKKFVINDVQQHGQPVNQTLLLVTPL